MNFSIRQQFRLQTTSTSTVIARLKSFAIRIPASYTIHGIDVSRWQERIDWQRVAKMRDNGIRLQFAFIKATEGESWRTPIFRVTGN
ncbi:GH25 family lysozyme [Escherichia coli]